MNYSLFTGDGKMGLAPLPPASEEAGPMGHKDPQAQAAIRCQRLAWSWVARRCGKEARTQRDTLPLSWIGQFPALAGPPGGPAVVTGSRFTGYVEGAPCGKDNPLDGVSLWEAGLEQASPHFLS